MLRREPAELDVGVERLRPHLGRDADVDDERPVQPLQPRSRRRSTSSSESIVKPSAPSACATAANDGVGTRPRSSGSPQTRRMCSSAPIAWSLTTRITQRQPVARGRLDLAQRHQHARVARAVDRRTVRSRDRGAERDAGRGGEAEVLERPHERPGSGTDRYSIGHQQLWPMSATTARSRGSICSSRAITTRGSSAPGAPLVGGRARSERRQPLDGLGDAVADGGVAAPLELAASASAPRRASHSTNSSTGTDPVAPAQGSRSKRITLACGNIAPPTVVKVSSELPNASTVSAS